MRPFPDRQLRVLGGVALGALLLAVPVLALPDGSGAARGHRFALGLAGYVTVLGLVLAVVAWGRPPPPGGRAQTVRAAFGWLAFIHGVVLAMVVSGALAGVVLFPLGAWLFGLDFGPLHAARAGLRDGAFYLFIWAPGTAIVLAFIRAHHRAKNVPRNGQGLDRAD